MATLQRAGLRPEVVVSGVDEEAVRAGSPSELAGVLARLKAEAVADAVTRAAVTTIVIGCDSLLEFDGEVHGKPADAAQAVERWRLIRGRSGVLHTGHHVIVLGGEASTGSAGDSGGSAEEGDSSGLRVAGGVASTIVHFAEISDAEIEAYVATGEPVAVAGAFTIDGLGGAFVRGIEGDPHTVVGISLPLLRTLLGNLGIAWPQLWR